jgi:hypothetical protein
MTASACATAVQSPLAYGVSRLANRQGKVPSIPGRVPVRYVCPWPVEATTCTIAHCHRGTKTRRHHGRHAARANPTQHLGYLQPAACPSSKPTLQHFTQAVPQPHRLEGRYGRLHFSLSPGAIECKKKELATFKCKVYC